jgi:hypothetical protein
MSTEYVTPTFKKPWLIQRLNRPFKSDSGMLGRLAGAFSFGGGLVRGGFSKEAWEIVKQLYDFDYMGSAEFEWGEVPKAFHKLMLNAKNLSTFSFEVDRSKYPDKWNTKRIVSYHEKGKKKIKKVPLPTGMQTIWVICLEGQSKEVTEFILNDLDTTYNERASFNLKEATNIAYMMDPIDGYRNRLVGWIELENPFMYFIDKEMYEGTMKLIEECKKG